VIFRGPGLIIIEWTTRPELQIHGMSHKKEFELIIKFWPALTETPIAFDFEMERKEPTDWKSSR
jgi:hypothetical protein